MVHIYPTPEQTRQIKQQVGLASTGVLTYHNGLIMTGLNLYAIFWVPAKLQDGTATSLTAHYESEAKQFLADYPYHGIANNSTQYYSKNTSGVKTYFAGIGGLVAAVVDMNPYPASPCNNPVTRGNCITDAQLQAEISKQMTLHGWTPGLNKIYLVFTSIGEGSCTDNTSTSCAYIGIYGYCAYHGNFGSTTNPTIYADMPYANPTYCYSAASGQHFPNGGMPADAVVSIASHEITEASTDPLVSGGPYGWYDNANGYEIGDLCAWMFGTADWDGGLANQNWNGHFYDIQLEYDNHAATCVKVGP